MIFFKFSPSSRMCCLIASSLRPNRARSNASTARPRMGESEPSPSSATNSTSSPFGMTSKAPRPSPAISYSILLPGSILARRNRIVCNFPWRYSLHSISEPGWSMDPLTTRYATWSGCQEQYSCGINSSHLKIRSGLVLILMLSRNLITLSPCRA